MEMIFYMIGSKYGDYYGYKDGYGMSKLYGYEIGNGFGGDEEWGFSGDLVGFTDGYGNGEYTVTKGNRIK